MSAAPSLVELPTPALVARAWAAGDLGWKLFDYQQPLYDAVWRMIRDPECKQGTVNVSRQFGKTHVKCLVACEVAELVPGAQIRFAAPTGLELRKRTLPILRHILADCPANLRPKWNSQDKVWNFPNGSQIHMAGVNDGHADDLRGSKCHLGFPDECGYIDEFRYLIDSVLLPMTTRTRGKIIGSSTPPSTTAHDFVPFLEQCEKAGNYFHATIHDTDLPAEEIRALCDAAGGPESITWRREYLAEVVVDTELQVIPEWSKSLVGEDSPSEFTPFWHRYSAMDIGATRRDFSAVLFAHYNFPEARIYVEDELIDDKMPRMNTDALARAVRAKELGLWGEAPLHMRVADNNEVQLLIDLAEGGMPFKATSKDELPSMVNKVRMWVKGGRVRIHPRCRNLILCLERGIWKDERHIGVDFDRNASLGHLDALAALVYLVRNVNESTNPIPRDYGFDPATQMWRRRHESGHALAGLVGAGRRVA